MTDRTPLDAWIAARIGAGPLTPEVLNHYQQQKLQETIAWARAHSAVYGRRLNSCGGTAIEALPLTSAADLRENPGGFLCVSQSEVSRVVTLHSSGTTGEPKRIYFTAEEQDLAIDFFRHGIATLAGPEDPVLIALPFQRSGSVGDLLATGIRRMGATPVPYGPVSDPASALDWIRRERVTCVVGIPVELLGMARCRNRPAPQVRSVALCSDYVSDSIVRTLRESWGCAVFQHYGSTEMGLGGGVDCGAHDGYHLREADLYFEVVHPETGETLPPGEYGEVVFTTLTRRAMPLIRYRTGDISRLLPGRCACGSVLRRLERVRHRVDGTIVLGRFGNISMPALDEALFPIPGVTQFLPSLHGVSPRLTLKIKICAPGRPAGELQEVARAALESVPGIRDSRRHDALQLVVQAVASLDSAPAGKRRIDRWAA